MPGWGFLRNGVKHFLVRVLSTFGLSDYIFQTVESRFVATLQDTVSKFSSQGCTTGTVRLNRLRNKWAVLASLKFVILGLILLNFGVTTSCAPSQV